MYKARDARLSVVQRMGYMFKLFVLVFVHMNRDSYACTMEGSHPSLMFDA